MDTQIEESRETVEQLLARRHRPKSYQEGVQYALDLVDMHLHEENPDRIDECIKLYADDAVREAPARGVTYQGRETIKKCTCACLTLRRGSPFIRSSVSPRPNGFSTTCGLHFAFRATVSRIARFPSKMRLLHNFHIRDGLIAKEIGYAVWRRAEQADKRKRRG